MILLVPARTPYHCTRAPLRSQIIHCFAVQFHVVHFEFEVLVVEPPELTPSRLDSVSRAQCIVASCLSRPRCCIPAALAHCHSRALCCCLEDAAGFSIAVAGQVPFGIAGLAVTPYTARVLVVVANFAAGSLPLSCLVAFPRVLGATAGVAAACATADASVVAGAPCRSARGLANAVAVVIARALVAARVRVLTFIIVVVLIYAAAATSGPVPAVLAAVVIVIFWFVLVGFDFVVIAFIVVVIVIIIGIIGINVLVVIVVILAVVTAAILAIVADSGTRATAAGTCAIRARSAPATFRWVAAAIPAVGVVHSRSRSLAQACLWARALVGARPCTRVCAGAVTAARHASAAASTTAALAVVDGVAASPQVTVALVLPRL